MLLIHSFHPDLGVDRWKAEAERAVAQHCRHSSAAEFGASLSNAGDAGLLAYEVGWKKMEVGRESERVHGPLRFRMLGSAGARRH